MRRRLPGTVILLAASLAGRLGQAQEKPAENAVPTTASPRRYFDRPIDFWRAGLGWGGEKEPKEPALDPGPGRLRIRESVWAQPIQTPDGSWMIYVPPPAVLNFLENPTAETAKAYVAWKADQAEKLKKAFSLLQEAKGKPEGKKEAATPPSSDAERPERPPTATVMLLYFHQKSCPHCTTQDGVLEKWLRRHPEVRLAAYERGERDDLWKTFQVRGTPTLAFQAGTRDSPVVLVGLQTEEKLEKALGALPTSPKEPNGGSNSARNE
jgi:hypothetical protein